MSSVYSVTFARVHEDAHGEVFNNGALKDDLIVSAQGSLKLVELATKEGLATIKGKSGDFTAYVSEVEYVDGGETRSIVRITAEADVVALVVRKRLAAEKKGSTSAPANTSTEPTDATPNNGGGSYAAV